MFAHPLTALPVAIALLMSLGNTVLPAAYPQSVSFDQEMLRRY